MQLDVQLTMSLYIVTILHVRYRDTLVAARAAVGVEEDVFYDAGAPPDAGDAGEDSTKPDR